MASEMTPGELADDFRNCPNCELPMLTEDQCCQCEHKDWSWCNCAYCERKFYESQEREEVGDDEVA